MDMELVQLDTAGIEVYKNMFKHGDIPITFGVVVVLEVNCVSWLWM